MADREDEEATFEALDDASDSITGPPAALLCGFERREATLLAALLHEIGGTDHGTVCCTTTMGSWSVARALGGDDGGTLLPVGKVPRVALLSGLTDKQVGEFLDRYGATGLPRPIFAVATPVNLELTVVQLLEDLMAERQAME
jgi:hypothetical protein